MGCTHADAGEEKCINISIWKTESKEPTRMIYEYVRK
jgi:hypothetical protein